LHVLLARLLLAGGVARDLSRRFAARVRRSAEWEAGGYSVIDPLFDHVVVEGG
jgi:hypothetical protein